MGLISLHETSRKNGGIGFAVEAPTARIEALRSDSLLITDEREGGFTPDELDLLRATVEIFGTSSSLKFTGHIRIAGQMRTHVGMGSGTGIRLAVLESIALLNNATFGREELVRASGRGGTSGIGINTYFDGGAVLDLGVTSDGQPFAPSSTLRPVLAPTALPRVEMPAWPLALCVPRAARPMTHSEEVEFFKKSTPLSAEASYRAAYVALFQIHASIIDRNYPAFCAGITEMQRTDWKTLEWKEHGLPLLTLKERLCGAGADCVGMSSLGPMLYAFGSDDTLGELLKRSDEFACDITVTRPANHGRSIVGRYNA